MFQINIGDFATRFKRGLGIKGRVPVGADETAVPVIIASDLTDPLFAQNPATFVAAGGFIGSTPNFWLIALYNGNPQLVTVIDNIQIGDASTTAPVTPILFYVGRNVTDPGGGQLTGSSGIKNIDVATTPLLLRMQTITRSVSSATNVFGVGGYTQWGQFFPVQNSIGPVIPCGIILYPGDLLGFSMGPEAATVSRFITMHGREFSSY